MNNYDLIFNNDTSSEHMDTLKDYYLEDEDESIKSLGSKSKLLREDIDYAFFEYAGSNIEHYIFGVIEK